VEDQLTSISRSLKEGLADGTNMCNVEKERTHALGTMVINRAFQQVQLFSVLKHFSIKTDTKCKPLLLLFLSY
jgi:hypothetical protein